MNITSIKVNDDTGVQSQLKAPNAEKQSNENSEAQSTTNTSTHVQVDQDTADFNCPINQTIMKVPVTLWT